MTRPPTPATPPARPWLNPLLLIVAVILPLIWQPLYERSMGGEGLCDEPGHMGMIYSIAERRPLPEEATMLPGYHFLVTALGRYHPTMTLARQVSAGFAILGTVIFALAWHRLHRRPAGAATLLFALLPILQPYTGMAYTEAAAVALLLAVWWAHDAGHHALTMLFFIAACCIRQTNAVWGGFIILHEALAAWRRTDGARRPLAQAAGQTLRRTWGLLLPLLAGVVVAVWHGRLTVGTKHGNQLEPNIAALHFAGVLVVLLGLPVWLATLARAPAQLRTWWATRRARLVSGVILGGGLAAGLAVSFANPHEWNRDLFWEGCTFTLLRNWPLVWMDRHVTLQAASGLALVLIGLATWRGFATQHFGRELWIILLCGALVLGTNRLVEPRYYLTPAVMLLLFLDLDARTTRHLLFWFAVICAVHAPFVALGLSLW